MTAALRFGAYYALFNLINALYQGYISLYLSEKGFTSGQIGLLLAGVPVAAFVAQCALSALSGRFPSSNRLLRTLCIEAALAILLMGAASGFPWTLAALMAFAAGYMAIQPTSDAILLEALDRAPGFGRVRMIGACAFALGSLGAGWLVAARMRLLPVYLFVGLIAELCFSFLLPETRKTRREPRAPGKILRAPGVRAALAFLGAQQLCFGYFFTFYPVESVARGLDARLLGVAYSISSVGEIAFLACSERLIRRVRAETIMLCAGGLLAVRLLLIAPASSDAFFVGAQALSGFAFGAMAFSGARFMADRADRDAIASGQFLLTAVGFGLARTLGNLLGAFMGDAHRTPGFSLCGALLALATVLYACRASISRLVRRGERSC